ncbi:universal stress protein [Pseudoduganella buxea]|uniref:Universal stress protein n=1 Tax=Pseudoduganella buxea TaxID=1949069 RepID=A0A6I3SUA2_9BURK|nr:universal stress protein [Pseudoduganella buxea]MTV52760.1 universal stress protein [Pseudoduganella buxea]GGB85424.1 universal stress protein [Pseudoduganella buxea]
MYRKILITTDGSAVSRMTACAGVSFAQQMGAEVLALFVAPEYQYPIYVEIIPPSYPSEDEYRAAMERAGREHTQSIVDACGRKNVPCHSITAFADSAALKIVDVAEQHDCNLIFIGSHGRSGWGQLLLGSVTNKVLSHSKLPVLVHRLLKEPVE